MYRYVNKYCLFKDQTQVSLACTQTLFYFSFRSFPKHRRAQENECRARERKIILPHLYPRSINPPRFLFFITRA